MKLGLGASALFAALQAKSTSMRRSTLRGQAGGWHGDGGLAFQARERDDIDYNGEVD